MGCILRKIGIGNPEEKADTLSTELMCIISLYDECWDRIVPQNKHLNRKKEGGQNWI